MKKQKQRDSKVVPFFGAGLLVDSARSGEGGKIDATGAFTILYAWSFPCTRSFQCLFTVFNLPKGKTSIAVSVAKRRSRKLKSLGLFDVESAEDKGNGSFPFLVRHKFEDTGIHELIFSFRDFPGKLRIPLDVRKREWPVFTDEELKYAKSLGEGAPSFRVNVHCGGCEHVYIFEEQLNDDIPPKGGVHRFPDDGIFKCEECDHEMDLRDIRGQLLASLKDTIVQRIGGNY